MESKKLAEMLKHIATYIDIYECLSECEGMEAPIPDVKEYLMVDCAKPESTARANVNQVTSNDMELLCEMDGDLFIYQDTALRLQEALEEIFHWSTYDESSRKMSALNKKVECMTQREQELEQQNHNLLEQINKCRDYYKDHISKLDQKIAELEAQILMNNLNQKTLLLSSVEIGPEKVGLYKDSQFPFADRHPQIDEKTMLMESFMAEIPDDLLLDEFDPEHNIPGNNLCKVNVQEWNIFRTFNKFLREKVLENMGPYKELMTRRNPMSNVITPDKILSMPDATNAEKMTLYVACCDDMSEEKAELIKDAARSGLDADFTIRILESKKVSKETKEALWNAIQVAMDASEYYARRQFAMELLEKKWYIHAVYCGRKEKFQLMPVCEIEALKKSIASSAGDVKSSLSAKQEKKFDAEIAKNKDVYSEYIY